MQQLCMLTFTPQVQVKFKTPYKEHYERSSGETSAKTETETETRNCPSSKLSKRGGSHSSELCRIHWCTTTPNPFEATARNSEQKEATARNYLKVEYPFETRTTIQINRMTYLKPWLKHFMMRKTFLTPKGMTYLKPFRMRKTFLTPKGMTYLKPLNQLKQMNQKPQTTSFYLSKGFAFAFAF